MAFNLDHSQPIFISTLYIYLYIFTVGNWASKVWDKKQTKNFLRHVLEDQCAKFIDIKEETATSSGIISDCSIFHLLEFDPRPRLTRPINNYDGAKWQLTGSKTLALCSEGRDTKLLLLLCSYALW